MNPRLGINIDHVATLRQARGEPWPCPLQAAQVCIDNGADQITVHLREDRRHIQDDDVFELRKLTKKYGIPLNLEMGASRDVLSSACQAEPDWICLVPEKRRERTTEGGLDLIGQSHEIEKICQELKESIQDVKISLFVESHPEIIKKALALPIDAVEIHTGSYAHDFNNGRDVTDHLNNFEQNHLSVQSGSMGYHAGHGLTAASLAPLLKSHLFEEYNIGHWVVASSIFNGLGTVVQSLKKLFKETSL